MIYVVEWLPDALRELADIWNRASDRKAVTAAQAEIDRLLARDPFGNGSHLSEGLYAIEVSPLRAIYTIDQARRVVEVNAVRYVP